MDDRIHIPEEVKENIINFLSNNLTANQATQLLTWLQESNENKVFFDQIADIWNTSSLLSKTEEFNAVDAWNDITSKLQKKDRKLYPHIVQRLRPFSRIAAILAIVILSGLLIRQYLSNGSADQKYVEMTAPLGSRSVVMLSDGTKVWLNSGSKIKFSNKYGQSTRDVKLEGEAYFSVAKNKAIPFIVHASELKITAVGTAFNVKAYLEEGTVETTLEEGSVRIETAIQQKNSSAPFMLKPKQKAVYTKNMFRVEDTKNSTVDKDKTPDNQVSQQSLPKIKIATLTDTKPFTSWKDNRWLFRHEPLIDLVRKLERRYDVEIIFKDEEIKNYSFSGSLYDESIEQVFDAIKLIAPIDYTINHKKIEISTDRTLIKKYEKLNNQN